MSASLTLHRIVSDISTSREGGGYSRSQTLCLILSLLKSRLQLALGHLQVPDVGRRTVQQGNLARLLVRNGQGLLQTAVAVPKLVTSALLRLDTLAADFLTATISRTLNESGCLIDSKIELYSHFVRRTTGDLWLEIVVIVGEVFRLASSALAGRRPCGRRHRDRVVAVGAGNRRERGFAAAAGTAGAHAVGGGFARGKTSEHCGVDAVAGRGVRASWRAGAGGVRAGEGIVGERVGEVKGGKCVRLGVRVLEIVEPRQGVVGEVGGASSLHEAGALGMLEGTFHCGEDVQTR